MGNKETLKHFWHFVLKDDMVWNFMSTHDSSLKCGFFEDYKFFPYMYLKHLLIPIQGARKWKGTKMFFF